MLDGWLGDAVGDQAAETIRLATTELVSNAVRHGELSADDDIVLVVDLGADVVRVDVEQPTSAEAARVLGPDADRDGGLGLMIV
ncbi:MAG TPA: ATP-binding protein, partial [Actinomycetota bacterium]|nr:ATP-binding protein [Actinomycetota bacterium]